MKLLCALCGKFLKLHLKQHPFCANLAVKWMLIQSRQVKLISAYNKAIGLDGLWPLFWKDGGGATTTQLGVMYGLKMLGILHVCV